MSDAASSDELLTVQVDSADSALAWAELGDRRWRCVVGAGGVREDKVEGDSATPVGQFPLRRLYFRNDRLVLPKVRLPARPIAEHYGWCDDPPEGEWGSAIFLHVAREDMGPTQGCVAFARADLLELVTLLGPKTRLHVLSLPAAEAKAPPSDDDDDMKLLEDFDDKDW